MQDYLSLAAEAVQVKLISADEYSRELLIVESRYMTTSLDRKRNPAYSALKFFSPDYELSPR